MKTRTITELVAVSIISLIALCLCSVARAESITTDQAVRAVIGEDSSSYEGMYAVACAIRNRDHLKGVYGLKAVRWSGRVLKRFRGSKIVETIDAKTYQLAQKAWAESLEGPDVTNGATHWEGISFPKPSWAYGMVDCGVHGFNRFYKAKKGV